MIADVLLVFGIVCLVLGVGWWIASRIKQRWQRDDWDVDEARGPQR